jgi:hypothetical protein
MVDYIAAFRKDLDVTEPKLRRITDNEASLPRAPGKWSPKQVLGHLIDSASVNHERFVRATQVDDLIFPGYDQDAWVEAQRYADADWQALIDLWLGYNRHLARVIEAIPEAERCRERRHHNFDVIAFRSVSPDAPSTLDYLMKDYVVHLEHHMTQILGDRWHSAAATTRTEEA